MTLSQRFGLVMLLLGLGLGFGFTQLPENFLMTSIIGLLAFVIMSIGIWLFLSPNDLETFLDHTYGESIKKTIKEHGENNDTN